MLALLVDPSELKAALRGSIGRTVTITFTDSVVCKVRILTMDDEGFVHSIEVDPGEASPEGSPFWTRFEDVALVETEES